MNNIYAIIIGIEKYYSSDITNLPFCKNDLTLVKNCMLRNLRIKPENITVLGDNGEVKRTEILRTLNFVQTISQDIDTLIFYFSGHGTSKKKEGYLVTTDTEIDLPSETSISITSIIDKFKHTDIKNKLLIIDSCYSGIDFSKGNQKLFEDFENNLDLIISEGWTLAASCRAEEVSWIFQEKDVSVYTYYFIESFNILPNVLGTNQISIDQINDYTTKKVAKWAFEHQKSQTPTLKSERIGSLTFEIYHDESYTDTYIEESSKIKLGPDSTKIILNTSKYFPESVTYKDYGINLFSTYRPNLLAGQEEYKTVNYTNKERLEQRDKYEELIVSTFLAKCLEYLKPSQIKYTDFSNYEFPFGSLHIEHPNDFQSSITFIIQKKDLEEQISSFLQELDNQDFVKWDSIIYLFDGNFNFDLLCDSLKKDGYKISKFDLNKNSITANFGNENDILTIGFSNKPSEALIEIRTKNNLPKDFFDILPIQKILEDFHFTIVNTHI